MKEFAINARLYQALRSRFAFRRDISANGIAGERWTLCLGDLTLRLECVEDVTWRGYRLRFDGEPSDLLGMLLAEFPSDACRPLDAAGVLPAAREELLAGNQRALDRLLAGAENVETRRWTLGSDLVRISFASSGDIDQEAAFLAPYYAILPSTGDGECAVGILGDHHLFASAESLWREFDAQVWDNLPGQPRLVSHGEGYRFFATVDGSILGRFHYPSLRDTVPVLFMRAAAGQWWVLHDGSPEGHRTSGRALRAFASCHAMHAGAIPVHASAFINSDGDTYLICGEKGAGKTTNLIAALGVLPGARLLSNDRVFLRESGEDILVFGSPHSIPVRIGSLLASADFLRSLGRNGGTLFAGRERGYDIGVHLRESECRGARQLEHSGEQLFFDPMELARELGTTVCTRGRLRGVIAPERFDAGDARWRMLPPEAARDLVARHTHPYFENASPYWNDLLPRVPWHGLPDALDFSRVSVWRIDSHDDLYDAWRSAPAAIHGMNVELLDVPVD